MHDQEHEELSTFLRWIQAFFALNIGKWHLKKNYEEKYSLTFHFLEKN